MRQISPHAKRLRREMTHAERDLWARMRNRQLVGCKFRRQWTLGNFVADFCCVEAKLVVEVDGGQHNEVADGARTAALEEMGYRVIRVWNNEVSENIDGVLQAIVAALSLHPDPLPQAGEGRD